MKKIKLNKKELVKEHEKIIPHLKKAGLLKDALEQAKDLKKYKKM